MTQSTISHAKVNLLVTLSTTDVKVMSSGWSFTYMGINQAERVWRKSCYQDALWKMWDTLFLELDPILGTKSQLSNFKIQY